MNEEPSASTTSAESRPKGRGFLTGGEYIALTKRRIEEDTCRKFGYFVTEGSHPLQVAPYYKDGKLVAQHTRDASKEFRWIGDAKELELFGQHLWKDGGKMVVVTEGEIDCMSVSQAQGNKWPVVSLPNGATSAKKYIQQNLEWLEQFDTVVLMFDMDDPGRKAVEDVAPLLRPGKCKVAHLPLKDANDMLKAGRQSELIDAIWRAKTFRPDGIVAGADTWDIVVAKDEDETYPLPWEEINTFLGGLRKKELVTVTAGSGIGKSLVCREMAYHLMQQGQTVGYVALEENVRRTALGFMSIELNKPLHVTAKGVSEDELRKAWERSVGNGRLYLYDHWGSADSDNLISKLRYLARGCDCGWLVLDHLSIVVSGIADGDERRLIDNTMTKLRLLVEETGVGMILVSHLKRPEGNKGHEDGLQTSLAHLRGSAAIAQLSDRVIGLERNQQDEEARNEMIVRVLKDRRAGITGKAGGLRYDPDTGRLGEVIDNPFAPAKDAEGGAEF